MSADEEKRFQGIIGDEYELFARAYPHFQTLQETLGRCLVNLKRDKPSILEIGCGLGHTTRAVLDAAPCSWITSIDNEQNMLDQASCNLHSEIQAGKVRLECADALAFLRSVPTASFDACLSAWTFHNFRSDYRLEVYGEVHRVLCDGGLFLNGDKYAHDRPEEHALSFEWSLNRMFEIFTASGHIELRNEWIVHMVQDNQAGFIMTEGETLRDLTRTGFSDVKVVWREQMEAIVVATK